MKQKLIFLDIDGTLLPPGEMTVPASAVEAIRQARANGHKVFLCTGRNLRMTKPLLAYGFDGFVCSAGGYVGCDGKILVDLPMEPAQVEGLRFLNPKSTPMPAAPKGDELPSDLRAYLPQAPTAWRREVLRPRVLPPEPPQAVVPPSSRSSSDASPSPGAPSRRTCSSTVPGL